MAVNSARNRGYPWATGQIAAGSAAGSEINNVRVFTAKGLSAPGTLGTSPLPQIGTPIPGTNLVYIRPRLSQDELGGSGGSQFPYAFYRWPGQTQVLDRKPGIKLTPSVHYTNPEFAFYKERRRTPSIGMARAGQVGATMGVSFEDDIGYFSVP